ncbi:MAG: ABC transporter permease [Anaerolineae bacterium]
MAKIVGIAWYEALMSWRRRGLALVVVAFTLALMGLLYALKHMENVPRELTTDFINAMSSGVFPSLWLLLAGVPLVAVESFPYDHRTQTVELLGGLPVSAASYLTGKVLGVCALALLYLTLSAVLVALFGWLLYGVYDLRAYTLLWSYTLLPTTLFAAALAVMLAVGCTTRRQALIIGILIGVPYGVGISIYCLVTEGFAPIHMLETTLFLLANAAGIWLLAWLWLRQREVL